MQEIDLTIEKMVAEGHALARLDRFVVFVEGALPGERVRATLRYRKKSHAFARVSEILTPSPHRVTPACPVFGHCGGCAFQHMAYPAQLEVKQAIVKEALHGVANAAGLVAPTMGMEDPFHFRNKMVYAFGRQDGRTVLGLHRRGDWCSIVPAATCLLQSPESREVLARMLDFATSRQLPPCDEKSGQGLLRHLAIREGKNTGERMVHLHATEPHPAFQEIPALLGPLATTVLASYHKGVPEAAPPETTFVLAGEGLLRERLNDFLFEIGPATFFQTNTRQAERLFRLVQEWAAEAHPAKAVDLYAGTGPIALHLGRVAGTVLGIEAHAPSVDAARRNLSLNGAHRVRMECAEAEKIADRLREEKPDLVVVDPPRPGLHPKALSALLAADARHLIYVSCNPATLARDLTLLAEAGYRAEAIQPVDMFPHTFHIEVAVRLKKSAEE